MQSALIALGRFMAELPWPQIAKWVVQTGAGFFLLSSFLITYRHNAKVRASDLLLKLDEHFNILGAKLAFLEYKQTCYEPVKGILASFSQDPDRLSENERATLRDIDECIRFLYICSLHVGKKIHYPRRRGWTDFLYSTRIPHAYYYYFNKLNDRKDRPELYRYLQLFFPAFSAWLRTNAEILALAGLPDEEGGTDIR
jgi:hypothetical protein